MECQLDMKHVTIRASEGHCQRVDGCWKLARSILSLKYLMHPLEHRQEYWGQVQQPYTSLKASTTRYMISATPPPSSYLSVGQCAAPPCGGCHSGSAAYPSPVPQSATD